MAHVVVMLLEDANLSSSTVGAALRECRLREAALHVVCIIPFDLETGRPPITLHQAFARLEEDLHPLAAAAGIELTMHVTGTRFPELIAGSVKRLDAELLVIKHSPRRRFWGVHANSLAKRLLDIAPCPILVSA